MLYIQRGKTDTHIIKKQEQGSVWIEFFQCVRKFLLYVVCEIDFSRFDTA